MTRFKGSLATLAVVVTALVACETPTEPTPSWAVGFIPSPPPAVPGPTPPPPVSGALVGAYALTVTATCDALPETERTRAYAASVALGPRGLYVVTLSESRFLSGTSCTANVRGLGCHQFTASESGETVLFHLEDLAGAQGSHIVEQAASGAWITISGEAVGSAARPVIEATGKANVGYCPTPAASPVACPGYRWCADSALRMTLTRR